MAPFIFAHSLYAASAKAARRLLLIASRMPRLEFTTPPLPGKVLRVLRLAALGAMAGMRKNESR